MKANELRIGNLITIDNSVYWPKLRDLPLIVTHIGQTMNIKGESSHSVGCEHINQKPNTYYETYSQFIENIKPIPLTEEWLLRFGFEKDDSGVDIFDQDYCEWYQKEFPTIGILCQSSDKSYIFDENSDTLRLKYVHELQNLNFALTGEELTI